MPASIARTAPMRLPAPIGEAEALAELKAIAGRNRVLKSFIGQGYHAHPHARRDPAQRAREPGLVHGLHAVPGRDLAGPARGARQLPDDGDCDLTGMAIANASMLDEATAAAEAMTLARRSVKCKSDTLVVAGDCHPQTIEVLQTRAEPLGLDDRARQFGRGVGRADRRRRLLRRPRAMAGDERRAPRHACRRAEDPRPRRRLHRRRRPARAHARHAAGRAGRRHRLRDDAALRHADGLRRPARRLPRLPRRVQARPARPARRRQHRRPRRHRVPPRAADARAAHPAREGDLEHLHGAGPARGRRQHVRRLPRARGTEAHRRARRDATPRCWPMACGQLGCTRARRTAPSTRSRVDTGAATAALVDARASLPA